MKSRMMKDPQYYRMIKEKSDGISEGYWKYPVLKLDKLYVFPKELGDNLVTQGYCELLRQEPQ